MSSSDDSELAQPQPAEKQFKNASKAFVHRHRAQASIKLAESKPPIKENDLQAVIRDLKPSVGDHITGSLHWTENMINKVASEYIDTNCVINQHRSNCGLTLYRTCLRIWRKLPTQIITPANGLVFKDKGDGNLLNDPMNLRLEWSPIFNERLTSLLVHPVWNDKLHYLLMALTFASMCERDDRRPWNIAIEGRDCFMETWELCQAKRYGMPKSVILDEVEKSLKAKGVWPCTICQTLQAIAFGVRRAYDEEDEGGNIEGLAQQQSLVAISANHLLHIQCALDTLTDGIHLYATTFYKTKYYYYLFRAASKDGNTSNSPVYPTSKGYQKLLKQARIGLVYDAYAYKTSWEKEKIVLSHGLKDMTKSSASTTQQSLSGKGNREELNEDQGGSSQRP
ncbi:hypothetical protein F4679DRAFT_595705 [Xylaria curta]|nr:hypothetical protein F4679DRAFT_595705 [Xylaria curta]